MLYRKEEITVSYYRYLDIHNGIINIRLQPYVAHTLRCFLFIIIIIYVQYNNR